MSDTKDAWDFGLKPRERLFVLYYCTDFRILFNGKQAYKSAYTKTDRSTGLETVPEDATCEVNSSKLLRKTKVKTAVSKLLKLTQGDLDEKNVYKCLHLIDLLSSYNPADIITVDGDLVCSDLKDLGELAMCIKGIEKGKSGVTVYLADRDKYMNMMTKYLNLVRDTNTAQELAVVELPAKVTAEDAADAWNKAIEKQEK